MERLIFEACYPIGAIRLVKKMPTLGVWTVLGTKKAYGKETGKYSFNLSQCDDQSIKGGQEHRYLIIQRIG